MRTQKAIAVGAILAALALTLFFPVSPGLAQRDPYLPYFVRGYVYDSTGSPVPAGVRVNITDETKGVTLNTTTDGTGFYSREIYAAIPEAEDGDLFTCSATYMNEGGLCSFILNRTANISQRCYIYLQAAPNTHTTTRVAGGGGGGALRTSTPSSISTPTPTPVVTPTPTPLVMPAQKPSPKPTPTPIPALGAVVPVIPLFIIIVAIIAAMITISVAYLVLKVRKKE